MRKLIISFDRNEIFVVKLFRILSIIVAIISIFMALLGGNVVFHFIITLANFYFITVVGVGIFYYYYHSFVNLSKGNNIDIQI